MFLLKLGSELQNLVKKFAVRYENINKLQTAFPRSGMHRGYFLPVTVIVKSGKIQYFKGIKYVEIFE